MGHTFELVGRQDLVGHWRHRDNGLEVLTVPTPVAPVASLCVVYRVGSRHERTGETGATHLLEHLMFKGTQRFNRAQGTEVARVLQRVGANFNATTWLDRTNYYATVPVEHLELAAEIEADRMRGALVRDEDLATEREVVLNELERSENEPFELLMKASFAHAYLEHPYHHPTIGWRADVESITAAGLRRFYDAYYHPDNATVIVAGDIDATAALEEIERRFGVIPPAPATPPPITAREEAQRGERRFVLERAGELGWLALSWHIPHALHPDLPPLSVLCQVLTEGVTSRLHQRLVETNRCLGVHAFAWELHDPGLLQVYATLAPGVPHREVEEAVREEVARLAAAPPEPEELARAQIGVRTDLAFQRESPGRLVAALSEAIAAGDWRRFAHGLEVVEAVTREDVRRVAAAYLRDGNLTAGWFVPQGNGGGATVGVEPQPQPQPCYLRQPFAERVVQRALPGGAKLAVLENPHAPTVTVAGSLLAGRAFATAGRFAVPGVSAAMLDRGTRRHDRLQLARALEDHGLQLGVDASSSLPSLITFAGQGLSSELGRLAGLVVEVLREPTFPADELEKIREQILGELAQERDDTSSLAWAALTRRLYPERHPHRRRPLSEREAEVRSLARGELEAFHGAAYGPAGLVLAVVGDVRADEVAARFGELLAGWEGGFAHPPEPSPVPPAPAGEELIEVADRPNLDVYLGHAAELRRGTAEYPAAILANSCLGQSTLTSRLGLEVRDRAGLTYGIYCRFFGTLHLPGPWAVAVSLSPQNLRRGEQLVREVLARYLDEGPEEAELADERLAQAGAYRVGLSTNSGVARELVTVLSAGLGVETLDRFPEELLEVDRAEVTAALRRHIHPDRLVLTAAGSLVEPA